MGTKKGNEGFSAALKAALDAVRDEYIADANAELERLLDRTSPIQDEASYEAEDDFEQVLIARLERNSPADPSIH